MQFGDALFNMINEFTAMNRCPDHRWRPTSDARIAPIDEHLPASSSSTTPTATHLGHNRRHSLQLTVGVSGEVAPINVQRQPFSDRRLSATSGSVKSQPRLSWWKSKSKERRQSEPMIGPAESLHKRLEYLKQKQKQSVSGKEEDEDEENKVDVNKVETTKLSAVSSNSVDKNYSDSKSNMQRSARSTTTGTSKQIRRTDRGSIIVLDENASSETEEEATRL